LPWNPPAGKAKKTETESRGFFNRETGEPRERAGKVWVKHLVAPQRLANRVGQGAFFELILPGQQRLMGADPSVV
jgi:hypothetical protein